MVEQVVNKEYKHAEEDAEYRKDGKVFGVIKPSKAELQTRIKQF